MASAVVFVLILATTTFATAAASTQKFYASENPVPVGSNVTLFSQEAVTTGALIFNNRIIVIISPRGAHIHYRWRDRVTFNSTTSSLTIRSLQLEDSGLYQLQAMDSFHARLTLSVQVPISNVTLRANATNLVEFNDTAVLVCSVLKGSSLSYVWLKGNAEVTAGGGVQLSDGGATLSMAGVTRYDEGPFRCNVSNGVSNEISLPVHLNISYGPSNTIMKVMPMRSEYMTGSNITLSCSAESSPAATIQWMYDGMYLNQSGPKLQLESVTESKSGNYKCLLHNTVTARFSSKSAMIRIVVPVSTPKISVVGRAVLGQPFKILCLSDVGSLPINYTLLRGYDQLSTITVKLPHQQALFTVAVNNSEDISKYMCEAKNSQREGPLSKRLNTTVIAIDISDITLSIEPGSEVPRGTNVTLRCQAVVLSSGQEALSREYTIFKGTNVVYTKTSSTAEDLLYPLSEARVSNTGKYRCKINIKGRQKTSGAKKLTVTGLSKPVLHLNKGVVDEGEEITAKCTAPGETGSMFFNFYEDSREISEEQVNSNQAEAKIRVSSTGIRKIRCTYTVLVTPDFFKSEESNTVTLSVKELPIAAVLEIFPRSRIYEGDQIFLSCTVRNFLLSFENVHLYLIQGNQILGSGNTAVNHSLVALAKAPGEFQCRFEMGNVVRLDSKNISVTELFSVPTLTMSPAEVFQRDHMTLTCTSESSASERLGKEELTYTLDPPESQLIPRGTGVFSGRVPQDDFSYTCVAQAKGIMKHSETLTVRPKAIDISDITLSIEPGSEVPRGTNVTLRCQAVVLSSGQEALSREYTIFKGTNVVYTKTSSTAEDLLYPLSEARVSNTGKYRCKINIKGRQKTSRAKKLTVTGLSKPVLHLNKGVVDEGEEITAKCTAPGETGSMFFNFYEDSREISEEQVNSNQAEAKIRVSSTGIHKIRCTYTVLVTPDFFKSEESNTVTLSVKVPLTQPTLTVIPDLPEFSEGDHLHLVCGVKGTPPVTFKWYCAGSGEPLYIITSTENNSDYQIPRLSKEHSGTYYCEAVNHGNNAVRSDQVTIEVRLALWKKVVFWVFRLLALSVGLSVVVVVCVLCFKSKRGKREEEAELSLLNTNELWNEEESDQESVV